MGYIVNQEKAALYLADNKLPDKCILCGVGKPELLTGTVYGFSDVHTLLNESNPSSYGIGSYDESGYDVIPVLPIICRNCGNTLLINPLQQGLLEYQEGGGQSDVHT